MSGRLSSRRAQSFLPYGRGAGGLVRTVIAIMVYLTALAISGGLMLDTQTRLMTRDMDRSFTVQIVEANKAKREQQALEVAQLLATMPAVETVRPVRESELVSLLEPWLGRDFSQERLPMPAMIDVTLSPGMKVDVARITADVRDVAPTARVNGHDSWLGPIYVLLTGLQWIAAVVVLLALFAMMAIVALATRSALAAHWPTIEVLHLLGTYDRTLAGILQRRFALAGLVGGLVGVGLAVGTLMGLLSASAGGLQSLDALLRAMPQLGWLCFALLPLVAALVTMLTVRVTVLRALLKML